MTDRRVCRWLLLSLDRLHSNRLTMTQELIANMFGVRREGVTEAAGQLQNLGVLRHSRGKLRILEVCRLEAASCGCYVAGKEAYTRVMG